MEKKEQKFTVILLPDEEQYQVIFPHYPDCLTFGNTIEEALAMAKEAIELHLKNEAEDGGDPMPSNVHVGHVVVAELVAEVPVSLLPQPEKVGVGG